VADRESDDVLEVCARDGIAFLPGQPLAEREQGAAADPRIVALTAIAHERQIDMAQAALAWLLARSPAMLPIPALRAWRIWRTTSRRGRSTWARRR